MARKKDTCNHKSMKACWNEGCGLFQRKPAKVKFRKKKFEPPMTFSGRDIDV